MKCTLHIKQQLLRTGLVLVTAGMMAVPVLAQQETLSAAEQEALAIQQPTDQNQKILSMCRHILLHGNDEQKIELLNTLGTNTCPQAVDAGLFDAPAAQ